MTETARRRRMPPPIIAGIAVQIGWFAAVMALVSCSDDSILTRALRLIVRLETLNMATLVYVR